MWTLYKHTNLYNGKIYIGITIQKVKDRWQSGSGYRKNKDFYTDIQKYGWLTGFSHEILGVFTSGEEAGQQEDYYISLYDTRNPLKGYNKAKGGYNPGRLGISHTEEELQKIKEKNSKSVLCLETNTLYPSLVQAEKDTGISFKNISACCLRDRNTKSAGGLHWIYSTKQLPEDVRLSLIKQIDSKSYKTQKKRVKCIELNQEWNSGIEAGKELNINNRNISSCCHHKRKTAGGYHWVFVEENE